MTCVVGGSEGEQVWKTEGVKFDELSIDEVDGGVVGCCRRETVEPGLRLEVGELIAERPDSRFVVEPDPVCPSHSTAFRPVQVDLHSQRAKYTELADPST